MWSCGARTAPGVLCVKPICPGNTIGFAGIAAGCNMTLVIFESIPVNAKAHLHEFIDGLRIIPGRNRASVHTAASAIAYLTTMVNGLPSWLVK
jgi:hypothetical protein